VGNGAYRSFIVDCIDTVKPVILFERSVLKVKRRRRSRTLRPRPWMVFPRRTTMTGT
jgi:hypothetical protein